MANVDPIVKNEVVDDIWPAIESVLESGAVDSQKAVEEIQYEPDAAFRKVLEIVDGVDEIVKTVPLGSNLRKNDFAKEIASLRERARTPRTMIAFFGGTGVGKSSLINAVLGDNIVPTSGMSACTAVVTEICYHSKSTFEADIEFMSVNEWEQEVDALLKDLKDVQDWRARRHELPEEAAIAWAKIHAVYPSIKEDEVSAMTVPQILSQNSSRNLALGKTDRIVEENCTGFSAELSRYLDQQDSGLGSCWPLIRKMTIHCSSRVLINGAVLVDLPGNGDTNAARSNIAQAYMCRANHFIIVAPIIRAVNDKLARDFHDEAFRVQLKLDGKYNPHVITFVATKCDDVSCDEIIKSLSLKNDPKLLEIEAIIKTCMSEIRSQKKIAKDLQSSIQSIERNIAMLENLSTDQSPNPIDTSSSPEDMQLKRKFYDDGGDGGPHKRSRPKACDVPSAPRLVPAVKDCSGSAWELDALKNELRNQEYGHSMALSQIAHLGDTLKQARLEKTALCARRRSEWSKKQLKADFKSGMSQFDESQECELDLETTELPVFACCARDHMRIIGKAGDDGEPSCFANDEDTDIPALSDWLDSLTLPAREKAAEDSLSQLGALVSALFNFIDGIPGISPEDRQQLREKWRSKKTQPGLGRRLQATLRESRHTRYKTHPRGIIPRLIKSSETVVDSITRDLNKSLVTSLQEECLAAASVASEAAVQTSDEFASGMFWSTYRATLRRDGSFRDDLNVKLSVPFTRSVAKSWSRLFELKLLKTLDERMLAIISSLLDELIASVPDYLKSRTRALADFTLMATPHQLRKVSVIVRDTLYGHQQSISRTLAPHVQKHLLEGYQQAAAVSGRGSVARQKVIFRDFLNQKKDSMFTEAVTAVNGHLAEAVKAVGEALDDALEEVAKKVEVNIAVLWECDVTCDDKARVAALKTLQENKAEIDRWNNAREIRNSISG